mgnify:CR=1 FL=1
MVFCVHGPCSGNAKPSAEDLEFVIGLVAAGKVKPVIDRRWPMERLHDAFERMSGRIARMSMTDPAVRQLRRLIYSHADRVDVDKAGRILIPQVLREIAGLDSEAMVVGQFDYFEIWSPEVWEQQNDVLKDTEANAKRFAVFDLSTGPE